MLCHRAEVAMNFRCSTADCALRSMVGEEKSRKPKESVRCHQTLPLVGGVWRQDLGGGGGRGGAWTAGHEIMETGQE